MKQITEVQSDWCKVFGAGDETTVITCERDEQGELCITTRIRICGASVSNTLNFAEGIDVQAKFDAITEGVADALRSEVVEHALNVAGNAFRLPFKSLFVRTISDQVFG